jgi:hypothetical protein
MSSQTGTATENSELLARTSDYDQDWNMLWLRMFFYGQ